ncbi:MAG: hypothetical protein K6G24_04810 [Lachnospiraceae bacterium]|nr:hypothetical protein [Lachnospiraceae bacterium]
MNNQLEKCYFELAITELAMEYYSLNEREKELGDVIKEEKACQFRDRLTKIVESIFDSDYDAAELSKNAGGLREEIKAQVESLVRKIDRLELEKYVDQRQENVSEAYDYANDDEAAKAVLRSVFGVNDNNLINERIKMAVYELPVRMTKVRFFDILKNSLKVYIGLSGDVLDKMIYLLESSSGLAGDAEFGNEDLHTFDKESLEAKYDYLNDLAGICNYLCVIGKCSDEVRGADSERTGSLINLIKAASELGEESNAKTAEKILTELEGRLEELSEKKLVLEARLEGYLESNKKPDEEAVKLESMKRLLSSSVYADIGEGFEENVDEARVEKKYEELAAKLDEAFKNGTKALNHARQAAVLSTLPVFFNSHNEVMEYVRKSLSSCSNIHEKNVAVAKILALEF